MPAKVAHEQHSEILRSKPKNSIKQKLAENFALDFETGESAKRSLH